MLTSAPAARRSHRRPAPLPRPWPEAQQTQNGVVQQLTLKDKNGVKTKVDIAGKDKGTGQPVLTEAKSSATAPKTKNRPSQKLRKVVRQ
jgi:hypothetical protein